MKQCIFLDTNIWIFLANGRDPYALRNQKRAFDTDLHMTIFRELQKAVSEEKVEILINEQVKKEIERNQDHLNEQIKKIGAKESDVTRFLEKLSKNWDESEKKAVNVLVKIMENKSKEWVEKNKIHNEQVQ